MYKKIVSIVLNAGLLFSLFADVKVDDPERISGSGYVELGAVHLDLDPIKKIVKEFDGSKFDLHNNTFVSFGTAGYVGQKRNGFRAGMGIWGGYKTEFSSEWRSPADSVSAQLYGKAYLDSVIELHIGFSHAGFMVEKSFLLNPNVNVYVGSMIGGGVLMALAEFKQADNVFRDIDDDYFDDDDDDYPMDVIRKDKEDRLKLALATYWAFRINGGATYSFTNWMHVGMDFSALIQYSSSGFGNRSGNFCTVNPGVRLRVIFGTSV